MYRNIKDFTSDWEQETKMTLKIFSALTEESLLKKVHPDVRTLGRLAWHITQTLTEMTSKAGLLTEDELEDTPIPVAVTELIANYQKYANRVSEEVNRQWTDSELEQRVNMYGQEWRKGTVLSVLVNHQIHHRAQMTIIMRLAGLKVPGIYGPAKEEWAAWGMTAHE
ncbi:MAG: DinB family protein [Sphingobacteriales bacterium]|nr:MAG: DinB family protein [Sphingobacteriales bacterium]